MKMQKLFENWNKFKSDVLREDILSEVSYEYAEHVEDWLADHGDEMDMPFKDIFKGEMRIVVPLGKSINPDSPIAHILEWLKKQGYETNFKTGLASKEFKSWTGNPKDPSSTAVMRMKHQKIGKVLQRALNLLTKVDQLVDKKDDSARRYSRENPGEYRNIHKDKEYQSYDKMLVAAHENFRKHFNNQLPLQKIKDWVEFWNKDSRYYRENPDKMTTDYSIIVSRHPVDVLRMSDFANISSCHSEGSDYFHCAIKEAKSSGLVAYVVETQDMDEIDMEDNEIFEDDDRGVPGIEPLARLRLRNFNKAGTRMPSQYNLAVPETRTYGISIPGFSKKVKEWALEVQKDKWSTALEDGEIHPDYLRDFYRKGGEYTDTSAPRMFANFFSDYGGEDFKHAAGGEYSDSEEEERQMLQGMDQYYEEMNNYVYELQHTAERLHSDAEESLVHVEEFHYEIVNPEGNDWTDEDILYAAEEGNPPGMFPKIRWGATYKISVMLNGDKGDEFPPAPKHGHDVRNTLGHLRREIKDQMMFATEEEYDYDLEDDYEGNAVFTVRFEGWGPAEHAYDVAFSDFCDQLKEDDDNYGELRDKVLSVLQEYEYAKPGFTDVLRKDLEENRRKFKKFILQPDNKGGYTLVYPMVGEPLLPDDYERADEIDLTVPAGRMSTRELLTAEYGDVQDVTSGYRVRSYTSSRFERAVIDNLSKLFARAHEDARKQMQLPLKEGQKKLATTQNIQDYIANGFTLGLTDLTYASVGVGAPDRPTNLGTATPKSTTVSILRFVLDDEPAWDYEEKEGFTYEETEEIFKTALNFVHYLEDDMEILGQAVSGILQNLNVKHEKEHSTFQADMTGMLEQLADIKESAQRTSDELLKTQEPIPRQERDEVSLTFYRKYTKLITVIDELVKQITRIMKGLSQGEWAQREYAIYREGITLVHWRERFQGTFDNIKLDFSNLEAEKESIPQIKQDVEDLYKLVESSKLARIVHEEVCRLLKN